MMIRAVLFNVIYYIGTLIIGILIVPSLLLPERIYLPFIRLYFVWVALIEKYILGLTYVVIGRENLPVNAPYIVAAKHQSAYETLKLPVLFNHPVVILKRELLAIPFWGWYAHKAGNIGINRNNPREALTQMVDGVKSALALRRTPIIFPQGTRVGVHETPTDKPYKRGIAEIYATSGAPVIPMAVNSGLFWPRNAFMKRPGVITIEFLPAVQPGLDKDTFMTTLQNTLEAHSNALVAATQNSIPSRKKRHPAEIPLNIATIFIFVYTTLWFAGAAYLQSNINQLWIAHAEQPFKVSAPTPRLTGFPGRYQMNWHGDVTKTDDGTVMYSVPSATVTFWPFPGSHLTINLPHGIRGGAIKADVQSFKTTIEIPYILPATWTKPDIQKLVDQKAMYRLTSLQMVGAANTDPTLPPSTPLTLIAQDGQLWFDDELQPTGQIQVALSPVEPIKQALMNMAGSNIMGRSFIGGALDTLTQIDPRTGERVLSLTFKLQHGKIYAGPVQIGNIGRQYWPVGNGPANQRDTGAPAFPRRTSPFTR